MRRFDFAIIGAGSAGLIAADFARKLGARVVLIERDRIGGDCTWTGCIPSKSLLKVARVAHEIRTAARFGVRSQTPAVDMADVRRYLRSTVDAVYAGTTPEVLRSKNIEVVFGAARFIGSHLIAAGDERIRAKHVLIATGAGPRVPSLTGIDGVPYFTYRNVFENDGLPASMTVVGGGPVGVEIAQAYQRLGTNVTMFCSRLLEKEEPEAVEIVTRVLQREGMRIVPERAVSVARTASGVSVQSRNAYAETDALLVAPGRRPIVEGLDLAAAGVAYSERGITVNDRLQTSAEHIYAAGDVVGGEQFSHYAGWQGFQAARNALLPGHASGCSSVIPRVTFTDPEVAQIGMTEAQARTAYPRDVVVGSWPIGREDRAVCDGDRDGLLKLLATRNGTILGATVVARRAGEVIAEVAVAMRHKLTLSDLGGTIHPYPTYSTGLQLLAGEMAVDRALRGCAGGLIRSASKLLR